MLERVRTVPVVVWIAASALWASGEPGVRAPAVAGQFYPADPAKARAAIEGFLGDAVPVRDDRPFALVLPHAGWAFSGQIAADGWRQVRDAPIDLVILLGTNHTVAPFEGVALWPGDGFRTPLGVAPVDTAATRALVALDPAFRLDEAPHVKEHSIEVQVPFVQTVLPGAKIVAGIVGEASPDLCARAGRALAKLGAGRRALLVASSDLSHYPAYDDAVEADGATLRAVASLDPGRVRDAIAAEMRRGRRELVTCACGEAPVRTLLEAVRAVGPAHAAVLSYANSGDGALADRGRVVGYGAVAVYRGAGAADTTSLRRPEAAAAGAALVPADGRALLRLARESIRRWLASDTAPLARGLSPALRQPSGVFVTLREKDDLRGCIGHTDADLPLAQVTGMMALHAAFDDPRFAPLEARELPAVNIEVSVLTPLEPVRGPEGIRLGVDGVVIRKGGRSALFLPEVATEQHWTRDVMLGHLCQKAGLAPDCWRSGAEFLTFRTLVFREPETVDDRAR